MEITTFDDLLRAARAQPTPQRLLLVFTQAELPDDATPEQRERFEAGEGGCLVPVSCVDKLASALPSFEALAAEAAQVLPHWDMVFAGATGPADHQSEAVVGELLQAMVDSVKAGAIGSYIAFDREGQAVALD